MKPISNIVYYIQYSTMFVILDLQENIYTQVPQTYHVSAGETGRHVVGCLRRFAHGRLLWGLASSCLRPYQYRWGRTESFEVSSIFNAVGQTHQWVVPAKLLNSPSVCGGSWVLWVDSRGDFLLMSWLSTVTRSRLVAKPVCWEIAFRQISVNIQILYHKWSP